MTPASSIINQNWNIYMPTTAVNRFIIFDWAGPQQLINAL